MSVRFQDLTANPRARRIALDAAAVVLAVIVGAVAFSALGRGELVVGPARLTVSLSPTVSPRTVVELPPFGSVEAPTHRGPVLVNIRLQEVDVVGTARMIERGALSIPETLGPESARELSLSRLPTLLWRLIGGGLLAAAAAGALVALLLRRSVRVVALAVAVAVTASAVAVGVAYATWDVAAFREPTLHGSLTYAPRLVDIFSTRVANITRLREQAARVAENLAAYYADERSLASGGALPGTLRVLHVTDLHLDPVGAELERSIARSYETSLVIDTGDLPILGVRVEGSAFASLVDTSVPRVYIPGNHDSPASIAALESLGVTVLTSGTVEVAGLRVFGVPDPISRGFGVEPDPVVIEEAARRAFDELQRATRSGEATPDIVAVHNPLMERPFIGTVPLVVSGHTHSTRFEVVDGTVVLNSGTLGGMPYDPAVTGRRALPYSASVLYFTAETPHRLIAIDRIAVYPTRSTTVSREVIDESLLP
jgi:predicted phosphodiesterase